MKQTLSRFIDRAAGVLLKRWALAERTSPAVKIMLCERLQAYRRLAAEGRLPAPAEAGFRVFSQCEEDGILLLLLGAVGIGPAVFVDVGGGDGLIASNCANLALNLGFDGVFVDADARSVERGRRFYRRHPDTAIHPPRFVHARVTRENVSALVARAGIAGEMDVLSIDIDGNDYWVWEALEGIRPRIVVVEAHVEFGLEPVVVPYDAGFAWREGMPRHYLGASAPALVSLGRRKGYRLVAANRFGFNLFFVRDDLAPGLLPAVPVESVLTHPRTRERMPLFETVRHLPFERV